MAEKKLTVKQKRFVEEFINVGEYVEAARRAGYTEASANDAPNWLNPKKHQFKPYLKKAIVSRLKELESKKVADAKEVMRFLTSAMRGELQEEVVVVEGTGSGFSEARTLHKQLSARDRLDAAKQLAKRYALDTPGNDSTEPVIITDDVPDTEVKSHADRY